MASGPTVGGSTGGDGDGIREKHRWVDSKVYTRKSFKGSKRSTNVNNNIDANTSGTSANDRNTSDIKGTENPTDTENANHSGGPKGDNYNFSSLDKCINDCESNRHGDNAAQPPPQISASEDGNDCQRELAVRPEAATDDSLSFNHAQVEVPNPPAGSNSMHPGLQVIENCVRISLASRSKQERRELRKMLKNELDMVRNLLKKIEAEEGQRVTEFCDFPVPVVTNHSVANGGPKRIHSDVASAGPAFSNRVFHHLSLSLVDNSQRATDNVEKEKRTPKANQFYRNSDFLLAKDKFPPAESNKKSKSNPKKGGGGEVGFAFGSGKYFKACCSLLEKLMKHRYGWVFKDPVDVEGLGLHDYYTIIKHPMDLGTVKSRLNKNFYKSPRGFAEDVRLTFRNAMTYNPKGQDVHTMANDLLKIFDDKWAIIEANYFQDLQYAVDYETGLTTPTSRKSLPVFPLTSPLEARRILDRSESTTHSVDPKSKAVGLPSRAPAPKKPKAKDPHKRDMTYEEKQKLSTNLQNLPSEKLDQIVQIIKKRNSALSQHDDEIEVDIDGVDAETLWELDRFVTNYKKFLSKNKRKAVMAVQGRMEGVQNVQRNPDPAAGEAPRETDTGDKNGLHSSSMHAEKPLRANASGSSSSSSSSSDSGSSSSDTDSESSSGSGSDEPQSPAN